MFPFVFYDQWRVPLFMERSHKILILRNKAPPLNNNGTNICRRPLLRERRPASRRVGLGTVNLCAPNGTVDCVKTQVLRKILSGPLHAFLAFLILTVFLFGKICNLYQIRIQIGSFCHFFFYF